jgi:hypothetical protein
MKANFGNFFKIEFSFGARLWIGSLLTLVLLIPVNSGASSGGSVGRVVLVKGMVKQIKGAQQKILREGDLVDDGWVVKSEAKAAAKIVLTDQSILTIGPSSSLNLDEIKNAIVPNIELSEGEVRTKVMKNILAGAIASHPIKFIIRTKSAAMGVRGTDFDVIYNPANQVTSLITFEGAVAMVKADPTSGASVAKTANLIQQLASDRAVVVTEGKFSSSNPALPQVTLPVKISPAQFESLKRSDPTSSNGSAGGAVSGKSYVSPVPPGVDPKAFSSTAASLDKQVASSLGVSVDTLKNQVNPTDSAVGGAQGTTQVNGFTVTPSAPPEGLYNAKTGSYAPPAGGFIDLKSGLYIPPPPGSAFDANTGVFVPPAAMGKFDSGSGSYVPPQNFQLDAKQGLVAVNSPTSEAPQDGGGGGARNPASLNSNSAASGNLASASGPSITPGFSPLNIGQLAAGAVLGANAGAGVPSSVIPGVVIPGMVGGALPGMNLPGNSNTGANVGYGAPITINLPLPPPPVVVTTNTPSNSIGSDPACPTCASPPAPPGPALPTSTKVGFSFTVQP